jgi:hypothetical protein
MPRPFLIIAVASWPTSVRRIKGKPPKPSSSLARCSRDCGLGPRYAEKLALPPAGEASQFTACFYLCRGARVGEVLFPYDGRGLPYAAIHRPIQMHLVSLHPHVGLIDPPRAAA